MSDPAVDAAAAAPAAAAAEEKPKAASEDEEEEEEEEESDDEPPAPRQPSGRTRKAVSRFDPISAKTKARLKAAEEAEPPAEAGEDDTTLGSLEGVVKALNKHGSNDEVLILLHRALHGRDGKATTRKAGIRGWFGTKDDAQRERLTRSMNSNKWTTALLGQLCAILLLDKSGVKQVVVDRVVSFLLHPVEDHEDKKLPKEKKPKKAKTPKRKKGKKKAKKAGPKRTASSYMLWMNSEGRAAAKAAHPEAKMTEIASYAGEMWRALSEEEKQPFVDQAQELKEEAANAPAAKKYPAPRKRKAAPASSPAPAKKSAKSQLKAAKELLDEGLIEQEEYDELKGKILKSLTS